MLVKPRVPSPLRKESLTKVWRHPAAGTQVAERPSQKQARHGDAVMALGPTLPAGQASHLLPDTPPTQGHCPEAGSQVVAPSTVPSGWQAQGSQLGPARKKPDKHSSQAAPVVPLLQSWQR